MNIPPSHSVISLCVQVHTLCPYFHSFISVKKLNAIKAGKEKEGLWRRQEAGTKEHDSNVSHFGISCKKRV